MDTELIISVKGRRGNWPYHFDCTLPSSGFITVRGANGAGKTTLLRLIAGLESPNSGHIYFGNQTWFCTENKKKVEACSRPVSMINQDGALVGDRSVSKLLALAQRHGDIEHVHFSKANLIEWLALTPLLNRRVEVLSGGEKRKVALAVALLRGARVILLDELLAPMDEDSIEMATSVLSKLMSIADVLLLNVSHESDAISRLASCSLEVSDGQILRSKAALGLRKTDVSVEVKLTRHFDDWSEWCTGETVFLTRRCEAPIGTMRPLSIFSADGASIPILQEQSAEDYR